MQIIAQGGIRMKQNAFRTRLYEARKAKKLSQLDVALELGVNRARISDWELGKEDLRVETVVALSRIYEDPEVYTMYMSEEHGADDLVFSTNWCKHEGRDLRLIALDIQNEYNDVSEEIPRLMKILRDGVIDDTERKDYNSFIQQSKELVAVLFPLILREEMQKKKALQCANIEKAIV